jgi:predicted Abi (CAAX) family protease
VENFSFSKLNNSAALYRPARFISSCVQDGNQQLYVANHPLEAELRRVITAAEQLTRLL